MTQPRLTRRTVLGVAAALSVPLLGAFLYRRRAKHGPAAYLQQNAVWAQSCFLRGAQPTSGKITTEADVAAFGDLLRANRIRNPYLFAGPYSREGTVPDYASSDFAKRTLQILKERAPDARIFPWLGGLQYKQVFLEEPAWVKAAIAATRSLLTTLEVSQVHLNFEYVLFGKRPNATLDYPRRFTAFFRALREALPNVFISTVIPSTASAIHPWKYQSAPEDVSEVLPYIDQLSVLYYDTHLQDQSAFEESLDAQLDHFARWKAAARPRRVELLMATGTFVNEKPAVRVYRDLAIENVPNSLATLRRALDARADSPPLVDGLAVFCDWETDPDEWADLRAGWFDRAR